MDWPSLVVGAFLAFVAAGLLWWVQFRLVVPTLKFGEGISRLTSCGEVIYRFKVLNSGRRGVTDVCLVVSLYLGKGLVPYVEEPRVESFSIIDIFPATDSVLQLRPGVSRVVQLDMRPSRWAATSPRLLRLAKIDPASQESVSLERLLSVTPEAYFVIRALAYDEVSGSRKYFESHRYYCGHIQTGQFSKSGLSVGRQGGW